MICPCYTKALYVVREDQLGVVESFGKFRRIAQPGPVLLDSPCGAPLEAIRTFIDLRVNQLVVRCETKTKDSVFCTVEVTVQFTVNPADREQAAVSAAYKIENFQQLLSDQVQDIVRQKLSKLELDKAFAARTDLQREVETVVGAAVLEYGYVIVKALVTNLRPAQAVVDEMNGIYTAVLQKQVSATVAETGKMVAVVLAGADAERRQLLGLGVSMMRRAYLRGMQQCLDDFVEASARIVLDMVARGSAE